MDFESNLEPKRATIVSDFLHVKDPHFSQFVPPWYKNWATIDSYD